MNELKQTQLFTFLMFLDLENFPLVIHLPSSEKVSFLEVINGVKPRVETDFMDEINADRIMSRGERAAICIDLLTPSKEEYFRIKYTIFSGDYVEVDWESNWSNCRSIFRRFTGFYSSFWVPLAEVPVFIRTNLKTAKNLKEEMGRGFYSQRIDLIEEVLDVDD